MNIDYLETLNLEVPFWYIISFFGRINVQCISSLVCTVYCQKQPSEQRCSVKQGALKDFVNLIVKKPVLESLFNKVAGLTRILKNFCQRLLLHSTCTSDCIVTYLFHFIFSTFSSSSLLLLLLSPMFVFGSNSKGFKEFKSGI